MSSTIGGGGYVPVVSVITGTGVVNGFVVLYAGGGVFVVSGRSNTEPSRTGGGFPKIDFGILEGSGRTDSLLT
jgi:hypothetical protein